jgi:site-specific DNA recombinase
VPENTKKRTAIYARSSTNVRTADSQLEACRRTAEHLGFDVIHEFIDEGISGTISSGSRPGTLELMANLGSVDVVLVYRLDRISRSAVELGELLGNLAAGQVEVWSVADLPIPARILTDQIPDIAAFAESERSAIRQRMDTGIRRAAEKGKWIGGPVPFGYDLDACGALMPSTRLIAGMTEAELARSVFERLAAGSSTIKEARRLNELEVFPGRRYSHKTVTMRRKNWLPSRINAMIRNSVYKGIHVFDHSMGAIERNVAALVSPSLWQAAQDGIARNRSGANRQRREYLLKGLTFCDDCGCCFGGTTSGWDNTRVAFYRCAGGLGVVEPDPAQRCSAKRVRAIALDRLVWADCAAIAPETAGAADFYSRRRAVEENVRRIGVHTEGRRPKSAIVTVDFYNGARSTYRFTGEDGTKL